MAAGLWKEGKDGPLVGAPGESGEGRTREGPAAPFFKERIFQVAFP